MCKTCILERFKIIAKAKGSTNIKVFAADGSGKNATIKVTVKVYPEQVNVSKEALYKIVDELKYAELKHLESGETKAVDAFEALELLSALEDDELEIEPYNHPIFPEVSE